jgi:hypothetical protein
VTVEPVPIPNGWLAMPLLAQGGAMLFDELYFHRRRGLPRWERIGHPIDTASVIACYAFAWSVAPSRAALGVYVLLAGFSCLLVTKDEGVHARRCSVGEQWLHSVLFVLHPIVLGASALLWLNGERTLLAIQAGLTLLFGLYQILYWNMPWIPGSPPRAR